MYYLCIPVAIGDEKEFYPSCLPHCAGGYIWHCLEVIIIKESEAGQPLPWSPPMPQEDHTKLKIIQVKTIGVEQLKTQFRTSFSKLTL